MQVRRTTRRLGAAVALVGLAAALTACEDPPTTVTASVAYDCQIKTAKLPDTTQATTVKYATTAPQAVAPNGAFTVTVVPEPFTVNGNPGSGGTVVNVSNLVWKVAVPANATVTSHSIGGWANVGAGTPTSSISGSTVTITVPGPIAASTTAQPNTATLPTLTLNLTATGAAGTRIAPGIAGTSYASPGLTFSSKVVGVLILGEINPAFSCFPTNRALHSTLVSADTKAPKITITAPVANQSIKRYAVVKAAFTCDDGTGVGVASCVGSVANGANLNTSTLGTKTFTVTASDTEGKVSTATVSYTVVA